MANEVNIKIKADDMASGKIDGISNKAASLRGSFVKLATAGAGVTTMLGFFTKAALEQQIGVELLDNALKTVNTSYEEQEVALEKTFASIQKLTNYGDDEQRNVLQKLIRATGDYELSVAALPVILDVAAGAGRDLVGTTDAIARALNGSIGGLSRYGIEVEEGSDAMSVLEQITRNYGGAAEAAKDPTTDLANLIGDLQEAIGDQLLPVLEPTVQSLSDAVTGVIDWTTENPQLTQAIVLGTAALGAFALVLGVIGIALPAIIAGATALATPLIVIGGLAGMFTTLKGALDLSREAGEMMGISFEGLDTKIDEFANTLQDKVLSVINQATDSFNKNTEAIDKNINKVRELSQEEKDALEHKKRMSEETLALHAADLAEIENKEKEHRKVIGAQIRAEQKAKKAAESGDFSMTFADFLAIENARVMGLPDVIDVGGRNMSQDLANAFRNFARGSQVSEHGEKGREAQRKLKNLMNNAGFFDDQSMPSIHGLTAAVPVNVIVNGDIYGQDDFDIKVSDAVTNAVANGNVHDIYVD